MKVNTIKVKSIKDEEWFDERANVYRNKDDEWEVNKIRGDKLIDVGFVIEVKDELEYSYKKPKRGVSAWENPTGQ